MVDLGLTPDVYWSLTLRELRAMLDRYLAREERQDRRFAMLAALYANAHRDEQKKSDPFTIEDFTPATNRKPAAMVQGSSPVAPCPECGVPRWQGHLPYCEFGQRHFQRLIGAARDHKAVMEGMTRHGR